MDVSVDEVAGIVDCFGGLTCEELERALSEVAYRDGTELDAEALAETITAGREEFALVRYTRPDRQEEPPLLVAGPTAFPTIPDHGEDLPYILEIEPRTVDREAIGVHARVRFLEAVEAAIAEADTARARHLLDVSYDLEAWAPVDLSDERQRLDGLLG